jgi:uncharacterized phage-associated protein
MDRKDIICYNVIKKFMAKNTKKIIEVANYFIKRSLEESKKDPSRELNALKLQKLLYYAKAWNLVLNKGDNLFHNEFQAWVYGPVNPETWQFFRNFDFTNSDLKITDASLKDISKEEIKVLEMVWAIYGKFDGKYLVNLTHSEEPWLNARKGLNQNSISQNIITDDSMREFYERRFKEEATT